MTDVFRGVDVAVPGGLLRVGVRDADDPDAPTVVLVHGVTSSHRAWDDVARHLPGVRLVAPDLRGRGRSNGVTGRAGMARHADDLVAVLDELGVRQALLVGHSMGAFVAVVAAHRHPERVSGLVLVDGGLPLAVPDGLDPDEMIQHVLGPTAERLAMRFATVEDYLDFWRRHPAFAADWTPALESYLAYDLVGEEPQLRPATSYDAMACDTVDLQRGTSVVDALLALRHPTLMVSVPRGLLDEEPGLYEEGRLREMLRELTVVRHVRLKGLNHYTVVISERGARQVATLVQGEIERG